MNSGWKREAPGLGLIVLMFALAAWQWPSAPERIPVHWDLQGQADGWGGKGRGLLALPLAALLVELLLLALPRSDPHRESYARFRGAHDVIRFSVVALLAGLYGFTLATLHGLSTDGALILPWLLGLFAMALGAVMGKLQRNWFFGVRTPWTLSSPLAWAKTHRLAGRVFVATGCATIAASLVGAKPAFITLFTGLAGGSAFCAVYSYFVWKSDPDRDPRR